MKNIPQNSSLDIQYRANAIYNARCALNNADICVQTANDRWMRDRSDENHTAFIRAVRLRVKASKALEDLVEKEIKRA